MNDKIFILNGWVEIDIIYQEEPGLDRLGLRCQRKVKQDCPIKNGKYKSGQEVLFVVSSYTFIWAFLLAQVVENLPAVQET